MREGARYALWEETLPNGRHPVGVRQFRGGTGLLYVGKDQKRVVNTQISKAGDTSIVPWRQHNTNNRDRELGRKQVTVQECSTSHREQLQTIAACRLRDAVQALDAELWRSRNMENE